MMCSKWDFGIRTHLVRDHLSRLGGDVRIRTVITGFGDQSLAVRRHPLYIDILILKNNLARARLFFCFFMGSMLPAMLAPLARFNFPFN